MSLDHIRITQRPGFTTYLCAILLLENDTGNARLVDDFQPRAQLKELYKRSAISSSDEDKINDFSAKYIVPMNLVRNYVLHLEHLVLMKQKRQREEMANKEARVEKKYEEYNWQDLYERGKISSLRVFELDKYIDHHRLSGKVHKMKKKDKVSLVLAHIAMTTYATVYEERELDDDNTSEDEDDIVLNEWGTSEGEEALELFCLCRQPEDERFMVCCDKWEDWFHQECLNMS